MEFLRTVLGDDLYAQVEGERYSKFALSFNTSTIHEGLRWGDEDE